MYYFFIWTDFGSPDPDKSENFMVYTENDGICKKRIIIVNNMSVVFSIFNISIILWRKSVVYLEYWQGK